MFWLEIIKFNFEKNVFREILYHFTLFYTDKRMIDGVKAKFTEKLEEHYGTWVKNIARFGSTSYGNVSKDLCISSSQFSKLISGTATEGMYTRSIENVERLIAGKASLHQRDEAIVKRDETLEQLAEEQEKARFIQSKKGSKRTKMMLFLTSALILGALIMFLFNHFLFSAETSNIPAHQHPLLPYFEQAFDADFDSPYLNETEIQDYCPCSAYEGKWVLDKPFKLPLPGSRQPGLYYLAKSSDMRMKCSNIHAAQVGKGKALAGYEYLVSEIWIDTEQILLIPKYFNNQEKTFTTEFENLDFEQESQFKKIATLHAFNVNKFEIHPDSIVRKAELTGRYASDVNEELALKYKVDVKHILKNVLGDLTKTNCQSTPNPFCSPNDLKEKESVIAFDCLYTIRTENLGFGGGYPYTKGFRLEKQSYTDNLTCDNCK